MGRTITTDIENVLSIIGCAEDYGHWNDVFMDFAFGLLDYSLSDEEILAHCKSQFLTDEARAQGYSEEDAEEVAGRLEELRDKYCKKVSHG